MIDKIDAANIRQCVRITKVAACAGMIEDMGSSAISGAQAAIEYLEARLAELVELERSRAEYLESRTYTPKGLRDAR